MRSPLTRGAGGVSKARKYLPYDKSLTPLARENRKNPSPAESLLWSALLARRHFTDCKFHRQKPIGRYIVDFYCAELALVIEVDGDSHAAQVDYDEQRSRFLEGLGLTVLRYANRDVLGNLEGVCEDLWGWVLGREAKTGTPPAPLVRGERIAPSPDSPLTGGESERVEIDSPLTRGAGGVSQARKNDKKHNKKDNDESPSP
ncbi:MAG: endonuclease domain-containing protein [Rhodocyclaceae bacterium]|nr:MAG: endonuclease domain-containing protein [Rhodocyclaceae bacterium]